MLLRIRILTLLVTALHMHFIVALYSSVFLHGTAARHTYGTLIHSGVDRFHQFIQ